MFDVLWTDPNRELVGERIIRKEQEAKAKEKEKKDAGRHSMSTNSSSSSDRGFSFFGQRKKSATPLRSRVAGASLEELTPDDVKDRQASAYGVKALLSHEDNSEVTVKPVNGAFIPGQPIDPTDGGSDLSSRESILSKWQPSLAASSTLAGTSPRSSIIKTENLLQTLGPSSFITKSTEIIVSARISESDLDNMLSEVHISSDRVKVATPPLPELPEEGEPRTFETRDPMFFAPGSPQTPPPRDLLGWNCNDRLGNPDSWKPPHEWDCTSNRETPTPSFEDRMQNSPGSGSGDHYMSPGLTALQREVRMMAAASPALMLANIKSGMGDASDATVYKELEMAKKRWMFSALHQNEGYVDLSKAAPSSDKHNLSRPPRILAIYETQASASFLAAIHPSIAITHLSPNPISPGLFPNVQPMLVPATSASAASRPLPPQLYSTVTCLGMPALFPSTEIPPFLRHVNRCLAPGGALHLTIIDPQPISASMGPKLRQWLFEKLLINLEQAFRTTYPSGTFPPWLAVGRLRGKGSTITTVSVPAVPEGIDKIVGVEEENCVKTELRCLVARMLWQEIWGTFVHADRWWWEVPEIMEECTEMGTYWQYSHIVAVKEDRQNLQS